MSPEEIAARNAAPCEQCPHPDGGHLIVAIYEDPLAGGVRLCPEGECQCFATWSVQGFPRPQLDKAQWLAAREEILAGMR